MAEVLHEGWALLAFRDDRPPAAGLLRYEQVGPNYHWVIDVPAGLRHKGYVAIIDPRMVKSVTPCTEADAIAHSGRTERSVG